MPGISLKPSGPLTSTLWLRATQFVEDIRRVFFIGEDVLAALRGQHRSVDDISAGLGLHRGEAIKYVEDVSHDVVHTITLPMMDQQERKEHKFRDKCQEHSSF